MLLAGSLKDNNSGSDVVRVSNVFKAYSIGKCQFYEPAGGAKDVKMAGARVPRMACAMFQVARLFEGAFVLSRFDAHEQKAEDGAVLALLLPFDRSTLASSFRACCAHKIMWSCATCTLQNPARRRRCEVCGERRPVDEDPADPDAAATMEPPHAVEGQTSQKNNDGPKTKKKRASVIKGWVRSKKRQRQERTPAAPHQGEDQPPAPGEDPLCCCAQPLVAIVHQKSITVRLRIRKEDEKEDYTQNFNEESSPVSRADGNATAAISAMAGSTNQQQQQQQEEEEPTAAFAILDHETDPQDKNVMSTVVHKWKGNGDKRVKEIIGKKTYN